MMDFETQKKSGAIPSTEGLPIYYDCHLPDDHDEKSLSVIIFVHGFKGFKDWGAFSEGCAFLSSAGFAVVAINFSLNGVGESMTEFDQLDRFSRETFSQDLDDLGSVIKAIKDGEINSGKAALKSDKMGLVGHSRGGHTAVAAAAEYPEISCLVTWSAVANYNDRWSKEMIADWESKGVTEIKNGRTGQIMPLKKVVYDDAQENAGRLMADKRAGELTIPAMFIHSKGDEAVSYNNAEKLYQSCSSENKELVLIPDSGHTFDTAHPFEDDDFPEAFQQVLHRTKQWFKNNLS